MIYRRRECGLVRTGLNVMWEPLAKGAILRTPWFSWYITWNRHKRRLYFAVPTGFNWREPIGPWRTIALQRHEIDRKERQILALEHALDQSNERYDRIREANAQLREANAQLRETLTLYRNEAP